MCIYAHISLFDIHCKKIESINVLGILLYVTTSIFKTVNFETMIQTQQSDNMAGGIQLPQIKEPFESNQQHYVGPVQSTLDCWCCGFSNDAIWCCTCRKHSGINCCCCTCRDKCTCC